MNKRIERLVIVGHGYLPYLSAIYIHTQLKVQSPIITVVDLGVSHGDPLIRSLGSMRHFHTELGFSEVEFVKKTKAEINLGFDYSGFSENGGAIFSDAQYGFSVNNFRFNYLFQKLKSSHGDEKFEDYCLSAKLARIGHFTPPSPNPKSVYSTINYGYRLTNDAYRDYLKSQVETKNIQVECAQVNSVSCDERGYIDRVYLIDGSTIEADLVIDASETYVFQDLLSEVSAEANGAQDVGIHSDEARSFNDHGPCIDVSHSVELSLATTSVSKITAAENTLSLEGDFQGGCYRTSLSFNASVPAADSSQSAIAPALWDKNCIFIGRALSGRASLLIDNSHLHQNTLAHLIELWPRRESLAVEASRFNANFFQAYRQLKNIDDLHLALAFNQVSILSNESAYKLKLFRETGKIAYYENELLQEQQWQVLFYALGIVPSGSDISVDKCDQGWLEEELFKIKTTFAKAAAAAPRYQDFIHSVHR